MTDVNYCGNHLTVLIYIKPLSCTPKTSMMLYVNYISILRKYHCNKKEAKFISDTVYRYLV